MCCLQIAPVNALSPQMSSFVQSFEEMLAQFSTPPPPQPTHTHTHTHKLTCSPTHTHTRCNAHIHKYTHTHIDIHSLSHTHPTREETISIFQILQLLKHIFLFFFENISTNSISTAPLFGSIRRLLGAYGT